MSGSRLSSAAKLGGASARSMAEEFYRDPAPEKLGGFIKHCMSLYNTRFADPDGMKWELVHYPWGYWKNAMAEGRDERPRYPRGRPQKPA